MTADELQRLVRLIGNAGWCRHWLHYNYPQTEPWEMAISCVALRMSDSGGRRLSDPVVLKDLEVRGFRPEVSTDGLIIYVIARTNEDGTPFRSDDEGVAQGERSGRGRRADAGHVTHDGPAAHCAKTDHWRSKWTSTRALVEGAADEGFVVLADGARVGMVGKPAREPKKAAPRLAWDAWRAAVAQRTGAEGEALDAAALPGFLAAIKVGGTGLEALARVLAPRDKAAQAALLAVLV